MQKKIDEVRREFNAILDFILQGALDREIHQVEDSIYRMLLRLGRILLELFVLAVGTGKMGQTVVVSDVGTYQYAGTSSRRYLSIFGEITILRAHYVRQESVGLFPLDARLNLPKRKYSYVLQDWMSFQAVETSFEAASAWVRKHLDLGVAHRPIQRVVSDCTQAVEEFMEALLRLLVTKRAPV